MSIEAESINSMSEPDTIGMGPQNPCGVSFRSHSGKNTEEYSLKFSIYLLKTIKLDVIIGRAGGTGGARGATGPPRFSKMK